jgi:hypothetical protein
MEALAWETARTYEAFDLAPPKDIADLANCLRTAIEKVLLKQGETFAAAVTAGEALAARPPDLEAAVTEAMTQHGLPPSHGSGLATDVLTATARLVLAEPAEPVQVFFRSFADAYTLFAFLRETPDVQSAVIKMFSEGEIWLDTTVVLPLMAETLLEDPRRRRFTNIFGAARDCGLDLRLTDGVLEEVERHTWNSIQYARHTGDWKGRVPFLFSSFALTGQPAAAFAGWMEQFRGRTRPREDIADYLLEEHGIKIGSLETEANSASDELRGAVQEVWHSAHERRRVGELDPDTRARLVAHDVENYLGVVQKREGEQTTSLGYHARPQCIRGSRNSAKWAG